MMMGIQVRDVTWTLTGVEYAVRAQEPCLVAYIQAFTVDGEARVLACKRVWRVKTLTAGGDRHTRRRPVPSLFTQE